MDSAIRRFCQAKLRSQRPEPVRRLADILSVLLRDDFRSRVQAGEFADSLHGRLIRVGLLLSREAGARSRGTLAAGLDELRQRDPLAVRLLPTRAEQTCRQLSRLLLLTVHRSSVGRPPA